MTNWNHTKPSKYRITVSSKNFFDSNPAWCTLDRITVIVENGAIVDGDRLDECKNLYDKITVESLFNTVDQDLASAPMLIEYPSVEFDPKLRFVSFYSIQRSDSFFSSDFRAKSIKIEEFTVLDQ